MKRSYVTLCILGTALALAACSKDGGSSMTPLSDANKASLKQTVASFSDVNTAVNQAHQQSATATTTNKYKTNPTQKYSVSDLVAAIGSTNASEKAMKMASKLSEDVCDISVEGLDNFQNNVANSSSPDLSNLDVSIQASGSKCPINYSLKMTATTDQVARSAAITIALKYSINSSDFAAISDLQSADFSMTLTADSSGAGTVSGTGQLTSVSQGKISLYTRGGGNKNGSDVHFGMVYPTFTADLHLVTSGSGDSEVSKMYLNDQPITEDQLKEFFAQNESSTIPVATPAPSPTPSPTPTTDPWVN